MTMTDTPSDPKSAGSDVQPVAGGHGAVGLTFEDRLEAFWKANHKLVIGACAVIALAIIGVGVWDYLAQQKEQEVRQEYAAATTPDALKAFAAKHPDHVLAGTVYLRT